MQTGDSSVEMSSLHLVLVLTVVSASCLTPVHVLEVCHSPDSFKSRWNLSVSNLTQALDEFSVSCRKLTESFPLDEVDGNFVRTVKNCIFSKSIPTPLKGPLRLAAVSKDVIEGVLELDVALTQSDDFLSYVSGRRLLPGSVPLAHSLGTGPVSWVTVEHIPSVSSLTGKERCGSCSSKARGKRRIQDQETVEL